MTAGLETLPLPLEGLEAPVMAAAPRTEPAAPLEPPTPREAYAAVLRAALPEGLVLSREFWAVALAGADEYAAALVEQCARRPGGPGRQR